MAFSFSKISLDNMKGVHPDLVRVIKRALSLGIIDFRVIEGVRTPERQKKLYAQGRTAPGPKVTWTLNSNHFKKADGYGHAVDILPAPYDWKLEDPKSTPELDDNFALVADAMFAAAKLEGVKIRWGANWDGDTQWREKGETDNPHFELAS